MREAIGRLLGMLLTILVPVTTGIYLYDVASTHEYHAFWDRTPGALMLYGRPPDARYRVAYARAAELARARGFRFADPQLVQTNDLFNLWYIRWQRSSVIAVSMGEGEYLLIDGVWMASFADDDIECIMVHEIGHIVDVQTNRVGHRFFARAWCLRSQEFADSFARYVCGADRYDPVFRKYIKDTRQLVPQPCPQPPPSQQSRRWSTRWSART